MIRINEEISIEENELDFSFVRSGGPGGQNVNKVASAVQLRFNVNESSLPEKVKAKLLINEAGRINSAGELVIDARTSRSQLANREDAVSRLRLIIIEAAKEEKPRKKTRPPAEVKEKRLEKKKALGEKKKLRKSIRPDDVQGEI